MRLKFRPSGSRCSPRSGTPLDDTLDGVTEPAGLEPALVWFSMRIATDWLDSAEYTTLQRLVRTGTGHLIVEGVRAFLRAYRPAT